MPRPRSTLLWTAVSLALIAVMTTLVVPRLVPVDSFRPELEDRLSSALNRSVTLGPLRLSLWRGVELCSDSLRIGALAPGASDPAPTLEAREVRVRVALVALMRGRLVARSFALRDAMLRIGPATVSSRVAMDGRFVVGPEGAVRSSGSIHGNIAALPGNPKASMDYAVLLREGRLVVESASAMIGPAAIEAHGAITGLRNGLVHARLEASGGIGGSRCSGTIDAELADAGPRARFDVRCPTVDLEQVAVAARGASALHGMTLHDLVAHGTLEHGDLRCTDATFQLYGGKHRASLVAQPLDPVFPFELECHLAGLPIEQLATAFAPERPAALRGTADLDLVLQGRAPGGRPETGSLAGTARLAARDGTFASVDVLRQLERLLGGGDEREAGRDGTPFRTMSATFAIHAGAGRTDDLAIRSDELDLDGHGTAALDGALDLDLVVSFSKEVSAGLVERNDKLRFRVGPDGRLTIPLRLAGSLTTPEVRLDVDRVLREGVQRILQDKRKGLLKKWLGGR